MIKISRKLHILFFYIKLKTSRLFRLDRYRHYTHNGRNDKKRIIFIGHSFHAKTKSNSFIIEYLKRHFDVTILLDESWRGDGKKYPNLNFIDKSYLGVIFWQNLPPHKAISQINNRNIIFIPMFDQYGIVDFYYWKNLIDFKIICFSKILYNSLVKWGFNTIYVQYFPEPQKFVKGDTSSVFFWQRTSKLNINIVTKLFNRPVNIHIHKAIDPNHKFVKPNSSDVKKFNITYSDWFPNKSDMIKKMNKAALYIAPRESEGIGLSFLEAMAIGKVVIASDKSTMNEYIIDKKTGFLYNVDKPCAIDFCNLEAIQRNVYQYMKDGYKKWNQDKENIIKFIKE